MEKYFKIGQKVWDVRFGEGVVDRIESALIYAIGVKFKYGDQAYTEYGRFCDEDINPSLFQTYPIITSNVPIIEFKKGELVLVKEFQEWYMRYYSHFENEKHHCFQCQRQEGGTQCWNETVRLSDNPLLTL